MNRNRVRDILFRIGQRGFAVRGRNFDTAPFAPFAPFAPGGGRTYTMPLRGCDLGSPRHGQWAQLAAAQRSSGRSIPSAITTASSSADTLARVSSSMALGYSTFDAPRSSAYDLSTGA